MATAFTSEDVMAATFNTDLLYEVGRVIANNCISAEIACLYRYGQQYAPDTVRRKKF